MNPGVIDSELCNKLITNKNYAYDYYNLFVGYSNSIEKKIKCITDKESIYSDYEQVVYGQIDAHFEKIINNFVESRNKIKTELNKNFRNFEESLGLITLQADEIKSKIDEQIKQFEHTLNQVHKNQLFANNETNFEFTNDNALQINESINEFDTDQASQLKSQFETIFSSIQICMQLKSETIDELVNDNYELAFKNTEIAKFVECTPEFAGKCFGYIEKKLFPKSSLDLLNHTRFILENSNRIEFECNKPHSITFHCPNTSRNPDEKHEIYPLIDVKLTDQFNRSCPMDLKVKETETERFFRVYFTPEEPGRFVLNIKYNGYNIPASPFYIFVPIKSEPNESHVLQLIKPEASKPLNKSGSQIESNQNENKKYSAAGRGRLLQKKLNDTMSVSISSPFSSQKRKSPSFDVNNNKCDVMESESSCETGLQELSSKLKKVSVDESANITHKISGRSVCNSMDFSVDNDKVPSLVSDHLRKYSGNKRVPGEALPNLKAKLISKYSNLKFPIGVRASKTRNWIIACESGNNSVKIFDRSSTKLIHILNGNIDKTRPNQEFIFFRPSAVLLDESAAEIFVKDDKQIQVFNIDQNFKLVRKFGSGLLQRPYGLAFNSNLDLVLVDADLRNPQVLIFNRKTGEKISAKPYEPLISNFSKDIHKNEKLFQVNKSPLTPIPIANTKIRFICTSNDFLYASDLGRSMLFKTDLKGTIKLAFGNPGRAAGQINEPSGIHVDNDGQAIIVGDSKNNRIQIYDAKGIYQCEIEFIGDSKLGRPSDIHLDAEGYLYVSNFTQENIKMFKILDN